ncbi:hypothetical protein MHPYR_470042 [uncultured Mycobacterium sp.]|uniref:Uncharacterized protein n=1 Tax=uncultured Mycobacterium sp. TaxID=171292 RepID=A0A1Y5PP78_9MYCO|nr:hypothetical protein MHPYR_470042 [uncultured Mycobacterium sp.]
MTAQTPDTVSASASHHHFYIDLEGDERPWPHGTITTAQVRELAGWPDDQQIVLVDQYTNEESPLAEDTVVELVPGKSFGRKFLFKRGLLDRTEAELMLIRKQWPDLTYEPVGQWVLITDYSLPQPWSRRTVSIAFQIPAGPAGNPPYGFYLDGPITCAAQPPTNFSSPAPGVPFPGNWGLFSWAPDGWPWAEEPADGANMRSFAQSFAQRFAEGA